MRVREIRFVGDTHMSCSSFLIGQVLYRVWMHDVVCAGDRQRLDEHISISRRRQTCIRARSSHAWTPNTPHHSGIALTRIQKTESTTTRRISNTILSIKKRNHQPERQRNTSTHIKINHNQLLLSHTTKRHHICPTRRITRITYSL